MADDEEGEPRQSELGRVEAFSDGVIAIIVTIMVLELKVPERADLISLLSLWPLLLAYLLSFVYVAIYWVNHHRLFTLARRVTNGLLWSNMALLFTLSLIPFGTAYLGEHHFEPLPVRLYMITLVLPAFTYSAMERTIERQARLSTEGRHYLAATRRKSLFSTGLYLIGLISSAFSTTVALGAAVIVAIFWILPETPLDHLFERPTARKTANRE